MTSITVKRSEDAQELNNWAAYYRKIAAEGDQEAMRIASIRLSHYGLRNYVGGAAFLVGHLKGQVLVRAEEE